MTKVFRFGYQKVLNLRQMLEDIQATSLSNSEAVLRKDRDKLKKLNTKKNSVLEREQDSNGRRFALTPNQLQVSMDYVYQLNDMIERQGKEVTRSAKRVETDRNDLLEATKSKKILERLREHHWWDYKKSNRKKETKVESEIAQRVVTRNRLGEG